MSVIKSGFHDEPKFGVMCLDLDLRELITGSQLSKTQSEAEC